MKKFAIIITVAASIMLSGCTLLSQGNAGAGGVMKSDDAGRTFEMRSFIDEKNSLAYTNVLSIAVDPTNNSTIYIGTDRNELYVSHDAAESWQKIDVRLTGIRSIVINPFDTKTIFVGGMHKGRGSVIRSDDSGVNWRRVYVEPADNTNITAMAISKDNGNVVYVGTSGGTIARTDNGGDSWENLYHANNSVDEILIDARDNGTMYALINGSDVVRSRDRGVTFESVRMMKRDRDTQKMYDGRLYSMSASPSLSGMIVVGTDRGVFRSTDYGQSWFAVDVIASTIGIPIHAITISPHNGDQIVYAAAKAVYTSVPDGWAITDTTSNRTVGIIAHDPVNPDIVYIGLKRSD